MQRISPASLRLGANDVCYEPAPAVSRSAWLVEVTVRGPDGMPRRAVIGDTERKRLRLEILEPGEYALAAVGIDPVTWRRTTEYAERDAVGLFVEERAEAARALAELAAIGERTATVRHRNRYDPPGAALPLGRGRGADRRLRQERAAGERRLCIAEVSRVRAAIGREIACQRARIAAMEARKSAVEFLPWTSSIRGSHSTLRTTLRPPACWAKSPS